MGGAYPCRMLVAVEASDDRPRAARCRRHSPGGKDDKERERGRGASLAGRGEKSSVLDGPPATVQQEQIRPSLAQLDGAR
jgi:hypothetical protein